MECRLKLRTKVTNNKLTNEVDMILTQVVENNILLGNKSCGVVYSNMYTVRK